MYEVLSRANILWVLQNQNEIIWHWIIHSKLDVQPVIPQPTASYVNGLRGQMRISRWGEWAALDTSTETNISSLFQILLWGEGRQGTDPLTSFLLTTLLCLLGPPYSPGDRFFSIVLLYFSDHEIIFWESEEDYILSSLRNLTKISIQFRICFIFINTNPLNLHQVGCIP